jgi:hypothetical protein
MTNIKCVKLVTNDDIICEYESKDDGTVELTNPVQVSMVPSRTGEPNFGFIPFPLVSNDKKVTINSNNVMFVCEPAEEFLNQYNQIFGSGIVTPSKKLIV